MRLSETAKARFPICSDSPFSRLSSSPFLLAMASSSPFSLLFLFSLLLSAAAQKPKTVILPVAKDSATLQYVARRLGAPIPALPALPAVIHAGGDFLWTDCAALSSSSFRTVPCRSPTCAASKSISCVSPNSCGFFPKNPFIATVTSGELAADAATNIVFGCAPKFLFKGLAASAAGLAGLGRSRFSLPSQLAAESGGRRRFALCLSAKDGVAFFGGGPYTFLPGIDVSSSLLYTPLLPHPVSYLVKVNAIKVNDKVVPGIKKTNMEISTVDPYTTMETSIYKAIVSAFTRERKLRRRPAVKPFGYCFDNKEIGSTRVGPAVPQIDLVLQSELVYWRIFGANSVVEVGEGVSCLAFIDGGPAAKGIVLGGYQMENNLVEFDLAAARLGFSSSLLFRRTTCGNFNFSSVSAEL